VAICIDSSAAIRSVSSARCRVTLNTDLAYRTALCSVTRNRSVVALVSRCFLMYLLWKYKIYFQWCRLSCTWYIPSIFSSTLSTTSHSLKCRLLNPHYRAVPLCTPMICVKVSPTSSVGVVCSMPQYFRQELFFRQLTGFYFFYIPEQNGTLLVVSVIKHTSQQPRIRSYCILYARHTIINRLLRYYSPTVCYLL